MMLVNQNESSPAIFISVRRSVDDVEPNRQPITCRCDDDQAQRVPRLRRELMNGLKTTTEVDHQARVVVVPFEQVADVSSELGNRDGHGTRRWPEPLQSR